MNEIFFFCFLNSWVYIKEKDDFLDYIFLYLGKNEISSKVEILSLHLILETNL